MLLILPSRPAVAPLLHAAARGSLRMDSTRRTFGLAVIGILSLQATPQPAAAMVEGIPLYAPSSGTAPPEEGFEALLPRTEKIRDGMPALLEAIEGRDWAAVQALESAAILEKQLASLGSIASILGDEAYTAVALKREFASSAKRLIQTAAESPEQSSDALAAGRRMERAVSEIVALVPQPVVDQVREYERTRTAAGNSKAAGG
ncbi:hypothetical protein AB1Y20_021277 [Prymnesium parvum]|uniref:Uncharacterized protein n=1 Tax=Prymnesium parvum TaxID=97485 RepID=A0AB34JKY3_PRYPA